MVKGQERCLKWQLVLESRQISRASALLQRRENFIDHNYDETAHRLCTRYRSGVAPDPFGNGDFTCCSRDPCHRIQLKRTNQVAAIVHGANGADTITANSVQFWFRRFRSGIFDAKNAPRIGGPVVKNVDKITEIIEVDWHVSSRRS
ncbi:histone-lysine N-methyltransferase SETMAR [Trichonephila clavipes]|nr:histone-lysine N-methyltransferase SETMAR [Trichonephila clavipes]